jgi:GNAT superfamily N-acetyltransferase
MPEIKIRSLPKKQYPLIGLFEPVYSTSNVWQMERTFEESRLSIAFNQAVLPRSVEVPYKGLIDRMDEEGYRPSTILIAEIKTDPVGFIAIEEQKAPGSILISDLIVKPNHRRQGIASALIIAAQDWALQKGYRRAIIELQSKNVPAIQLCKRLGYDFCGYHDHYYANHDIALFFGRFLR